MQRTAGRCLESWRLNVWDGKLKLDRRACVRCKWGWLQSMLVAEDGLQEWDRRQRAYQRLRRLQD